VSELLKIEDLVTSFRINGDWIDALRGVSFTIDRGQTIGLVGESGSGKSVTAMSVMRLLPEATGRISRGRIVFDGAEISGLDEAALRKIRGNQIGMIFQEPMTSLNPVFTIGDQVGEVFRVHQGMSKKDARIAAVEMLRKVNIPAPETRVDEYPHQLSGGMRQRIMIAMALACRPKLLIADEPTTALDVTIQAQIMHLIKQLQSEFGMAMMLITHDLGVVAETCEYICVMYGGKIVEQGPVKQVFAKPTHPYTQGLLRSRPRIDKKLEVLPTIPGQVPGIGKFPIGCSFQNRCELVSDRCRQVSPELEIIDGNHHAACFFAVASKVNEGR
jgi:oligopeptide/dipeptide ABC transporter ATP-binding protein